VREYIFPEIGEREDGQEPSDKRSNQILKRTLKVCGQCDGGEKKNPYLQ
jgi:hypothetical protein